jgi:hypothetical protein
VPAVVLEGNVAKVRQCNALRSAGIANPPPSVGTTSYLAEPSPSPCCTQAVLPVFGGETTRFTKMYTLARKDLQEQSDASERFYGRENQFFRARLPAFSPLRSRSADF